MDIVLQGTVAWLNKDKMVVLVDLEVAHMLTGLDQLDKVRPGQKVTIILEQREKRKGGDTAEKASNKLL